MRKNYNRKYKLKNLLAVGTLCLVVLLSGAWFVGIDRFKIETRKSDNSKIHSVTALTETTPVPQGEKDDSADDPAIWVHPEYPDSSRIFGTDKKGGLAVYDLKGKERFYYPDGKMNNVDLRYGFALANEKIDILAVSNRTSNSINLYRINSDGSLETVHQRELKTEMKDEVYGLCIYKSPKNGKCFVFINNKEGEVEQWELFASGNQVDGRIVRKLKLAGQVEGMVADDQTATLFVGEEKTGIWKFKAEPNASVKGTMLSQSSESDHKNIRFDIEGLAIYSQPKGKGYLVASSQGNDSYAIFRRQMPHQYLGSFKIVDDVVDGVEGTDGLDVTSIPLGRDFPNGLLVVQDGSNKSKGQSAAQNFKLVPWERIASALHLP